jgi:hypothetical protein
MNVLTTAVWALCLAAETPLASAEEADREVMVEICLGIGMNV